MGVEPSLHPIAIECRQTQAKLRSSTHFFALSQAPPLVHIGIRSQVLLRPHLFV